MKRFISLICAILTITMLFTSCTQPADTTADGLDMVTQEVPNDPVFDLDEEETSNQTQYLFNFNLEKLKANDTSSKESFYFDFSKWASNVTTDGSVKNEAKNGNIRIMDKDLALTEKNFTVECDVTFDELPHVADGVDAKYFPMSVITWCRKSSSQLYDWAIKLDNEGNIYIKDTSTPSSAKIEAGKKHTVGANFDLENGKITVYLDGKAIGVKSILQRTITESYIRIFDEGSTKAHFSAKLHAARAYYAAEAAVLSDAETDIYTAMAASTNPEIYFLGYTDKDALSYKVGEEMTFEIYLMCNGNVVSVPYFYYTINGEDGQTQSSGYADGSTGHFTVKAKMSKPGAVRITAHVCDENQVKQTKNNSNLYVNLSTTAPQKADLCFQGGAIAGFDEIKTAGKVPADLAEFWDGIVNECYKGDINVLRFEKIDGGSNPHDLYLVEIEAADGFVTGYLSIPQNASKLKIRAGFASYGNAKKPYKSYYSGYATFSICAHSYHLDDPNAKVPDKNGKSYGFYMPENNDRDTTYFKNMLIRNIIATRFLKAYVGDGSYGKIVFGNQVIEPLNKWNVGDEYYVGGGSQAAFQSVAMAALDNDVTTANFALTWFCDIAGPQIGRFKGWKPDYTDALMYYDSCALATLIENDVDVTLTGGLGDDTSEPSSIIALYNAINAKKKLTMTQNREHNYNPPVSPKYSVESAK